MSEIDLPVPRRDGLNGEFFRHVENGELRFQRCDDGRSWRHMPRYSCAECHSLNWSWQPSTGRGILYSWNVNHRSFHPAFNELVPYAVCVIEMEEGVRMVSQLIDIGFGDYRLNMPVEVVFVPRRDAVLPMFRPRE